VSAIHGQAVRQVGALSARGAPVGSGLEGDRPTGAAKSSARCVPTSGPTFRLWPATGRPLPATAQALPPAPESAPGLWAVSAPISLMARAADHKAMRPPWAGGTSRLCFTYVNGYEELFWRDRFWPLKSASSTCSQSWRVRLGHQGCGSTKAPPSVRFQPDQEIGVWWQRGGMPMPKLVVGLVVSLR